MDKIVWKKKLNLKKIKSDVFLVGLPGIGLIGRISIRYIIDKLKAEKIADVYSKYFPAQALMGKNGRLRLLKQSIYFLNSKTPIIFLTGDVQPLLPEGQFLLSQKMVNLAHKLGVSKIITIGGYSTGAFSEKKRIFGASNSNTLISEFKKQGVIFGEAKGSIIGMAGIMPAYAKTKHIPAICLMGETHGAFVDASSSKAVVELLSNYLEFKIDLKELDDVAKEGEQMIKNIEKEIEKANKGNEGNLSYIR